VPAEPGFGCSGGGHVPPTAGLIVTACAVIAPPGGALFGPASTSTQLPAVTSGSFAAVISVTIVCGEKLTTAAVLFRCVRWIVLPDTELTRPSVWSWAIGGGGGLGAALGALIDVLGFPLCSFDDVLHATTDTAMAPVTTRIAARVCPGFADWADINGSPITGRIRAMNTRCRPSEPGRILAQRLAARHAGWVRGDYDHLTWWPREHSGSAPR